MKLRWSGDTLLLVEWEHVVDPEVNERAIRVAERLQSRLGRVVRDIVPSVLFGGRALRSVAD